MSKERVYGVVAIAVAFILIVGIFGYYLGSKGNDVADEESALTSINDVVVEEKPVDTTPPVAEVVVPQTKEWIIEINNYTFVPGNLTVGVNDKVTWVNMDHYSHKIVADHAEFVSRPLQTTNDTYSFIFTRAGAYTYRCGVHGDAEKGEVIVA